MLFRFFFESLYEGCCFGSFLLFWVFYLSPYMRHAILGHFLESLHEGCCVGSFLESLYEVCCFGSLLGVLV